MLGKLIALAGIAWLATRPPRPLAVGDRVRVFKGNAASGLLRSTRIGTVGKVMSIDNSDNTVLVDAHADGAIWHWSKDIERV